MIRKLAVFGAIWYSIGLTAFIFTFVIIHFWMSVEMATVWKVLTVLFAWPAALVAVLAGSAAAISAFYSLLLLLQWTYDSLRFRSLTGFFPTEENRSKRECLEDTETYLAVRAKNLAEMERRKRLLENRYGTDEYRKMVKKIPELHQLRKQLAGLSGMKREFEQAHRLFQRYGFAPVGCMSSNLAGIPSCSYIQHLDEPK